MALQGLPLGKGHGPRGASALRSVNRGWQQDLPREAVDDVNSTSSSGHQQRLPDHASGILSTCRASSRLLESLLGLESTEVWGGGEGAGVSKHLVAPLLPPSPSWLCALPIRPPRAKQTAAEVPRGSTTAPLDLRGDGRRPSFPGRTKGTWPCWAHRLWPLKEAEAQRRDQERSVLGHIANGRQCTTWDSK